MNIIESFIIANFITFSVACGFLAILYIVFNKIFTKGKMIKFTIVLMFFTSMGIYTELYFKNNPWFGVVKVVFSLIVAITSMRLILKIEYFKIILTTVMNLFFSNMSTILVTFLLSLVGISVGSVKNSFPMFVIVYCLIDLCMFLILATLNSIKKLKNTNIPRSLKKQYLKNLFPSVVIILCLILMNSYIRDTNNSIVVNPITIIINLIFLTLFLVLSMRNLNNIVKLSVKDSELELQILYNEKMKVFIGEIKRIKENYNNTVSTLERYVSMSQWEELEIYYKELYCQSISINSIQRIISLNLKNPALLGLISSKMEQARSKNLYFDVIVQDEFEDLDSGVYCICDILGCLMDNAIEAANSSECKVLLMKISTIDGNLCFRIENSYKDMPDINKIFKKGSSTKGEGRGNGLWYVKNKVDKEDRLILNTIIEKQLFIQELILLNEGLYERDNAMEIVQV